MNEHPIDAAAHGALRGPPVPRRPPWWLTWGVRAAPLLPIWSVAAAIAGLPDAPHDPLRTTLVVAAAVSLLLVVANLCCIAGRPRLDTHQQAQLVSDLRRELGPDANRRLHRILWRGEAVPDELRPWAEPFLLTLVSGPQIGLLGLSMSASSILLSTSRSRPLTTLDVVFLVLVAVSGCVMAGVVVLAWRARRIIRRDITARRPVGEDTL